MLGDDFERGGRMTGSKWMVGRMFIDGVREHESQRLVLVDFRFAPVPRPGPLTRPRGTV